MTLDEYSNATGLVEARELDRIALLAYYRLEADGVAEFELSDFGPMLLSLHLPEPNYSRLAGKMISSALFVRGSSRTSYRLHAKKKNELSVKYGGMIARPPEVQSDSSILPDSLLLDKRTYIQCFGKQINAAYSAGIFDGCAVLMRRLLEVSLIHAYENLGLIAQIEVSAGRYKDLKIIIADAEKSSVLKLSKETTECLDDFRELGNLSAHRLHYNCRHEEIDKVKHKYRLMIEELFSKAGKHVEK